MEPHQYNDAVLVFFFSSKTDSDRTIDTVSFFFLGKTKTIN